MKKSFGFYDLQKVCQRILKHHIRLLQHVQHLVHLGVIDGRPTSKQLPLKHI